jgi:DNA-binding transcriptional MocR family regulator
MPTDYRQHSTIYQGILRALESDISARVLKPGDVLPTHRYLADRLGVAVGTITKAYKEAEKKSLIVGRGRKGTFVRSQDASESVLAREIRLWYCDDNPLHTVAYGVRVPDFARILKKYLSRPAINPRKYWPPESHRPQHYQTGVQWLKKLGYSASPDSLVLTLGNHHGLLVALATETTSGDAIAAEKHTFISLKAIADFLSLRVIGVESDAEGMHPDALESACRRNGIKAILCMPSVQNPTNVRMSEERRQAIVRVARRNDLMIIEDEVCRPVADDPPPLIKHLAPGICYLLASPSKILAPGFKIGYVVPPEQSKTQFVNKLRGSIGFTGGLSQEIFGQMMKIGIVDEYVMECRREGQARQQLVSEILPGEQAHTNPASYFVWLELPSEWSPPNFAKAVNRFGVSAWAASMYAVEPNDAARAIRFNVGQAPNRAAFSEVLRRLSRLLESPPRT